MQPLPHHYNVTARATEKSQVEITSPGLTPLASAPPEEFGGPGNLWSPETLAVAAVADCFTLTFRAIAGMSKLGWTSLVCDAKGTVDRAEGVTRFTAFHLNVQLRLPESSDAKKAAHVLEKAEKACLVGNSFKFEPVLEATIALEAPALPRSA